MSSLTANPVAIECRKVKDVPAAHSETKLTAYTKEICQRSDSCREYIKLQTEALSTVSCTLNGKGTQDIAAELQEACHESVKKSMASTTTLCYLVGIAVVFLVIV